MTTSPPVAGRTRAHELISGELARASDEELLALLSDTSLSEVGYSTVCLPGDVGTVFAKLVPVTDLELTSRGRFATANILGLPPHYHYRIGSCGFGAWRELEAHRLANEWVLSEQCPRFPLLHHWRVLPIVKAGYDDRRSLRPWGDNREIRERVAAINSATSSVVLLLEYFPHTLDRWFPDQMKRAADPARLVTDTEGKLKDVLAFIHGQGLIHLDAHFGNLLTDGNELYLADYGLSLSRDFELASDEQAFFEAHQNFDLCTVINSLVHAVLTFYDARSNWRAVLREVIAGAQSGLDAAPDSIRSYLVKRAPLVFAMGEFYGRLLSEPTTSYPAVAFRELLADAT